MAIPEEGSDSAAVRIRMPRMWNTFRAARDEPRNTDRLPFLRERRRRAAALDLRSRGRRMRPRGRRERYLRSVWRPPSGFLSDELSFGLPARPLLAARLGHRVNVEQLLDRFRRET